MARPRKRPVGTVDVAASALARLTPKRLRSHVDQVRHDLNALVDGFSPSSSAGGAAAGAVPVPLDHIDPIEHIVPRLLRRRYVTLKRDVSWVARDLRGEGRPPVIREGKSATPRSALEPRPLRVTRVERETPDAVTLHLAELDASPLTFEAGQFLTFHLLIDGSPVRRAYSLSCPPGADAGGGSITVKRIEGGTASTFLTQHVAVGDVLRVLGPSGSFTAPAPTVPTELVMIGGGSGITPLYSVAAWALAQRSDLSVRLIYGNRREADVIFRTRLARLVEAYPGRFTATHVFEEVTPSDTVADAIEGRIDAPVLQPWLDALEERPRRYYLCGPGPMMDGARTLLETRGVPPERIHEERFQSPVQGGGEPAALPAGVVTMQVRFRGRNHVVPVVPGQTVLEASLAAGAMIPFSCAMGGCGACKGRLSHGEVFMEEPNCLNERERAARDILTCQARPLTDDVVVEVDG